MATAVYVLCAAASVLCAALLIRGLRATGSRLLLWSALCFGVLAVNNLLLVLDLSIVRGTDLGVVRAVTGLVAPVLLVYGFIFDLGRGDRP